MDMVRPELRASLSTAIEQAGRVDAAVVAESSPGSMPAPSVSMTVVPASMTEMSHHFLILFGRASERQIASPPMESGWDATPSQELRRTGTRENTQLRQRT